MGSFTVTAVKSCSVGGPGGCKRAIIRATGPASYDTGGSVLDMSSANTVLTGLNNEAAFNAVQGVNVLGVGAAASDKYRPLFVPGSSDSPSTGVLKIRDLSSTDSATEVAGSADLHGTTWTFEVFGN
ncbi:MAG: hypothetical protein IPQ07_38050 [Myxococcales bacterium]|nr:hypothetical protein [Myxococcales bacterium]